MRKKMTHNDSICFDERDSECVIYCKIFDLRPYDREWIIF